MNIIENRNSTFGIMWEIDSNIDSVSFGKIQLIIDNEIYPNHCPENYYAILVIFENFKGSFITKDYPAGSNGRDFGEGLFNTSEYNELKLKNVFTIETSDMGLTSIYNNTCNIDCLKLEMGYSGDEERLFYSFDYGESYREIRFPRGTVEAVIEALPSYEELLDDKLYKERLAKVLENTSIIYRYE
jgi:hypothetical protein